MIVGGLHAITANWAMPDRPHPTGMPLNALEGLLLARMLDNWLDNAIYASALQRIRLAMQPEEFRWLSDLVNELYPLPHEQAAAQFTEGTVH